jgi:hypothetical protein
MFFLHKRFIKISAYLIALLLFVLAFMGCSKLESNVTSFSEKVKEKFHAKKKETVTASRLNLRKEPSTQSHAFSVLRKGDELEVYHLTGKWAKVKTSDGREGWVYARYITGFEDLFTEKQHLTETKNSTHESKAWQPTPSDAATVEQKVKSGQHTTGNQAEEGSTYVFSHPEKLFSLRVPVDWDNNTDHQDYFEKHIFKDPLQEIEIWVVYTSTEDYSADEFYRDLAYLVMVRSGDPSVISTSTSQKAVSGPEWLY